MNNEELKNLLNEVKQSGFTSFELKQDDFYLKVKKESTEQPIKTSKTVLPDINPNTETDVAEADDLIEVKAPFVGVVYLAPSENDANYVEKGSVVTADQTVCLIEAMKMFNEVHASSVGTIEEVLVENGTMVQFDQPLFTIRPSEAK